MSIDDVAVELGADLYGGIEPDEAHRRLEEVGLELFDGRDVLSVAFPQWWAWRPLPVPSHSR